jgi:hypothetical protein
VIDGERGFLGLGPAVLTGEAVALEDFEAERLG